MLALAQDPAVGTKPQRLRLLQSMADPRFIGRLGTNGSPGLGMHGGVTVAANKWGDDPQRHVVDARRRKIIKQLGG